MRVPLVLLVPLLWLVGLLQLVLPEELLLGPKGPTANTVVVGSFGALGRRQREGMPRVYPYTP